MTLPTAALRALDLVISVDTAVAHLAGALGKPVWVLNRFDTDFRWPRDRDDSPWYPSLRQFRQPTPGPGKPRSRQGCIIDAEQHILMPFRRMEKLVAIEPTKQTFWL